MFSKCRHLISMLCLASLLAACSTSVPSWRDRTSPLLAGLTLNQAPVIFQHEYRNLLETFEHGEALYQVRKDQKAANIYYQLAFQKARILTLKVEQEQKRLAVEKQRKLAEVAAKAEQERLMRAAAEAELRLKAKQADESSELRSKQKKNRISASSQLTSYTVRRGETLPQISAKTEIYNDPTLWPIIYRANRDQIRDPKRLWPGQILVIPRNLNHDEAVEARHYSNKK